MAVLSQHEYKQEVVEKSTLPEIEVKEKEVKKKYQLIHREQLGKENLNCDYNINGKIYKIENGKIEVLGEDHKDFCLNHNFILIGDNNGNKLFNC